MSRYQRWHTKPPTAIFFNDSAVLKGKAKKIIDVGLTNTKFRLDNFNDNMKIPPIRSNFETEAEFQQATQSFEKALVRQDQYDVFINCPISPDLLSTGGIPSRLSKHFYEHLNTGFLSD